MKKTETRIIGSNGKRFDISMSDEALVQEILENTENLQKIAGVSSVIHFTNQLGEHFLDYIKPDCDLEISYYERRRAPYLEEAEKRELKYGFSRPWLLRETIEIIEKSEPLRDFQVTIKQEKGKTLGFSWVSSKRLVNYFLNLVISMIPYVEKNNGIQDMESEEADIFKAIFAVYDEMHRRDLGYAFNLEYINK